MPDRRAFVLGGLTALLSPVGRAARPGRVLRAAVAANFQGPLERLGAEFARRGGARLVVSAGATGMLYTKIAQGAPFDLFFAADRERPERLEREGLAVAGSRFTYAEGQLVAWRPGRPWRGTLEAALRDPAVRVVAIADPGSAPYGAAAMQVLEALGLARQPPFRLVQGESLGQTFQFLATGNADLGFVSLAQILEFRQRRDVRGETLAVEPQLHAPILQDAVILGPGADHPGARGFMDFVRSPVGRRLIERAGYRAPGS